MENTKLITNYSMDNIVSESMSEYMRYVILDRAIPDFRDGLKPVQRRIIWTMYENGLDSKARYVKGSRVVGDTMGKYHSHGDGSISGALIKLSQDWYKRNPLVDVHGNNGSIDGSGSAAMRYYEARLSPFADLMTEGLKKNAVDMVDNFDGTLKEPTSLPAAIPQLFINGSQGIASGMATSILPHNPLEMIDAMIEVVKDPTVSSSKLAKIIKGPDFPTGGIIIGHDDPLHEIENGRGSKFTIRGRVKFHEDKNEPYLEVTEIPWNMTTDTLIESFIKVLNPHLKTFGIEDIGDESTNDGLSLVVRFKKGTRLDAMKKVETMLLKRTKLQTTMTSNNTMIVHGRPRVLGIRQYLVELAAHRIATLKRIWAFEKDKLVDRQEIVEGLLKLIDISDEVVKSAKASASRKDFVETLQSKFGFTERQSETIANLALHRLGRQDLLALQEEFEDNSSNIARLTKYIEDEEESKAQTVSDLLRAREVLKSYKRLTEITSEVEELVDVTVTDLVESKPTLVVIKKDLRAIRIGSRAYENQISAYKEDDIVTVLECMTSDYIVMGTKSGKTVTRLVEDLENASLKDKSVQFNKEIDDLKSNDEFVGAITSDKERIITISRNGAMKVMSHSKLMPNTNTRRYINSLNWFARFKDDGDEIVSTINVNASDMAISELVIVMKNDKGREIQRVIDLAKLANRSDSGSSTGFKGLNTNKLEITKTFLRMKEDTI